MGLVDDVESDDVEPTVLLVFPDDVPLAFVWFLSRTILLLTSQHWLEAVPLDPELVPVPCAFAIPATAMSAAPVIAARQILFIEFPLSLTGKNADKSQCGRSNYVPLNSLIAKITRGIYRYGQALIFEEELPHTPAGKVMKHALSCAALPGSSVPAADDPC
jgi:hypothetical protein